MSTSSGRAPLAWPWVLVLLVLVYAAGTFSVAFAPEKGGVAAWWPAAGLSIALVALSPRRRWPVIGAAILVACVLANISGGRALDSSAVLSLGDTAEALLAAALLRRGDRSPTLESFDDLARITFAALVGAVAIALAAPVAAHLLGDEGSWITMRTVYTSHATSALVILPAALVPTGGWRLPSWEVRVQAVFLAVVTALVFAPGQTLALSILPLPALVWGALRLELRVVAWEIVGFAVLVTYLSARGGGPFGGDFTDGKIDAVEMATLVQAYLLCAAVVATPLALAMDLRRSLVLRLAGSEQLFRSNFTESLVGMLLLRPGAEPLEIIDANDAATRLIGATASPLGRGLDEVLDTEERLDLVAARLLAGELAGWRAQTGLADRPGARVTVAVSLLSTDPEPVFAAQLLDVTSEYDARRRLVSAEKLTSATLDTAAAIILVTDLDGTVIRANNAVTALTGFTPDRYVDLPIWEAPFAPPGATGLPAGIPTEPDAQVSRETDVLTATGDKLRVLWNTSLVRGEDDSPSYVVLTGTDLTGERAAAGLNTHLFEAAITTALIGIDTHGLITVFNAGAAHLLGYDAQDMVGTPFTELLDPEERLARTGGRRAETAFIALTATIGVGGESKPRDWTWIASDGSRHIMSMTLSVASDRVASRIGYLCVGRDVTESRASQELLVAALDKERMAVERMRQLDAAKNEFVSTVSHELRTPVASIVGYTEMLQDGSVDEPTAGQSRLLASIERSGQRLIGLCEDLLTLGGLDSGAMHWDRTAVDLNELIAAAEDTIKSLVAGRDLTLVFTPSPVPVLVLGDRAQLDRVVVNLLSNAVKFTEDGGRVECRTALVSGEATLVVSDTGIGIPEDEQSSLFQRFFRSSTAQHRAIQGTGLGLSIVAATVAAHGGQIDVRSAHLKGTTITVRLPVTRPGSPR